MSFNPKLIDVAIVEQLIQMFKMLDVSCQMVQKHNVQENSQHLRERRVSLICGFLLTFFISAADADHENLLRPSRITGLRGCCRRAQPSPKKADPRGVLSFTGWKTKGIAQDAQTWSTVIFVATVTSRIRFHIGWPFFP